MRETAKAREACRRYVDMGPERSLDKLAELMVAEQGKHRKGTEDFDRSVTTRARILYGWSSEHGWVARAAVHDDEIIEDRRERFREQLAEADTEAFEMVKLALNHRRGLVEKGFPDLVKDMPGVTAAVKLLHDIAGEPFTEKHEHKHSGQVEVSTFLDSLSDDQRKQFAKLSRSIGNGDAQQADEDAG